jgi:tRNA1Val (adenine37-N6)-methyltransferase
LSNSYFQFKKFRIDQADSLMKVSTDGCILGAYTPVPERGNILDIGTGTGLLSLMVAQRSESMIDAVELDYKSFVEARENFKSSEWSNRLHAFHSDIVHYNPYTLYDLIICNPPFFEKQLQSPDPRRNLARHNESLPKEALAKSIGRLLKRPTGQVSILLPPDESDAFERIALQHQLFANIRLLIRDAPSKPIFRVITIFSFTRSSHVDDIHFVIRQSDQQYSKQFAELLKPYYLHL